MLNVFCAGFASAVTLIALAKGYDGIAAFNAVLVAANVYSARDLILPAQRHSATAHGACDTEATDVAQNSSAAVRPHAAPLRGNGDFGGEER